MKFSTLKAIYLIIALFLAFIELVVLKYTLPIFFNLIGGMQYIWIGYIVLMFCGVLGIVLFYVKNSIYIGTNVAIVIQGFVNGFFTGSNKPERLGRVIFNWPRFIYRSRTTIPLSIQVIPLKRIENNQEIDIAVTSKDGMLVKVVGSFEFQITEIMLFYDKIWELGMNWDKSLVKAGNLLSRILETYIENVVSNNYDLEDMDPNKKKISEESLEKMRSEKLPKNEFAEYGVRLVRLHITDFDGDDIIAFRKNEAAIQEQENKLALSDEEKKTQLGILANKQEVLAKENEVIDTERKVAEAKAEMEKAIKLIQAHGLADAMKIDLAAKKEFQEIFKYVNGLEALVEAVKADSSRNPQLTSRVGGINELEGIVSFWKAFQQAINQ
ncbi:MAG: SPFH domain-containing protein [Patescibacteria group bacterium]|nr:SPFH domain-containing protein [Patescibacteria group bacterium]MDD4304433.1 SPFH domain-containing protein [Patescibacteria group bacterium]MDD4695456.1 SPFH domain-containing protein [Patescibacteria group bacterium]